MTRPKVEALQRTALFGAIDDETIEFLLSRAARVEVVEGDCFFREGDSGNSAFLLESGVAVVSKDWRGEEHPLRRLVAGDCFGEVALLDLGKRSASIRAEVDAVALEIRAIDLRAVAKRDPEQFALIYMNIGRELSRRLRDADDRAFRARFDDPQAFEGYAFAAPKL